MRCAPLLFTIASGALAAAATASPSGPADARKERNAPTVVVDAPSNLGLRPLREGHIPGAWRLSSSLRATGLMTLPGLVDGGTVPAPAYDPDASPAYGFRHGSELRQYTIRLAKRLGDVLDGGAFTLVLGGDCSVLLGSAVALKKRGRYGLVFIDGHTDFPYPRHPLRYRSVGFTAAGLDLGLATGHGPVELTDIEGLAPYFDEANVVALGYRQAGTDADHDLEPWRRSAIHKWPLTTVRDVGIAASAQRALKQLEASPIDGVWIHLDADVLDPDIMPAVDSPEDKGGMTFAELEALMSELLASPRIVGLEFTIFDPDLDPDGALSRRWVDFFRTTLARRYDVRHGAQP